MRITNENIKKYMINETTLFASDLKITSIESFPSTLERIFISGNNLCELPELPSNLKELYCYDNNLMSLPKLPLSLVFLDMGNNIIEDKSFDQRYNEKDFFNNKYEINENYKPEEFFDEDETILGDVDFPENLLKEYLQNT